MSTLVVPPDRENKRHLTSPLTEVTERPSLSNGQRGGRADLNTPIDHPPTAPEGQPTLTIVTPPPEGKDVGRGRNTNTVGAADGARGNVTVVALAPDPRPSPTPWLRLLLHAHSHAHPTRYTQPLSLPHTEATQVDAQSHNLDEATYRYPGTSFHVQSWSSAGWYEWLLSFIISLLRRKGLPTYPVSVNRCNNGWSTSLA